MKFRVASAGLILVVVMGVMVGLYFSEKKQLWRAMEDQQQEDLAKLAKVCQDAFTINDEIAVVNYAKTLVGSPKVTYVNFSNTNGVHTWSQDKSGFNCPSRYTFLMDIFKSKKFYRREWSSPQGQTTIEVSQPVGSWGFVSLGYSKSVIQQMLGDALWKTTRMLGLVFFITILFGLLGATILSDTLTRPIHRLVAAAQSIAQGNKGVQVEEGTSDELGHLVRTFNDMSKELTKLDELKDEFMSHVTHELRSPLTSIIATVELLAEMPLASKDAKFRRSIDRLIYGSERLNRLVDNILDLTRMEAGKMQFDLQPIHMAGIVTEMADFFEPRAMEKGLKISAIVNSKLPLATGDPERVRQILSNLIYNAIKFTNTGGIVVFAKEQGGLMHVGVQDTGVGIPKDKLGSIFEKFETLKDTRNRVTKPVPGSGLGLNIVRNSIKAQGGKIWVESEIDKGSTFIFTLPLAPVDAKVRESFPVATFGRPLGTHKDEVFQRPENKRQVVIIEEKKRVAL